MKSLLLASLALALLGIVAAFIVVALVSPDPKESYMLLAALGFVANAFGAQRRQQVLIGVGAGIASAH